MENLKEKSDWRLLLDYEDFAVRQVNPRTSDEEAEKIRHILGAYFKEILYRMEH